MRVSLRRIVVLASAISIAVLTLGIIVYSLDPQSSNNYLMNLPFRSSKYTEAEFQKSNLRLRRALHYTGKVDYIFEQFVASKKAKISKNPDSGEFDLSKWEATPLNEQCNSFFNYWKAEHEDWSYSKQDLYDKSILNKASFFNDQQQKLKDTRKNLKLSNADYISKTDNDTIEDLFISHLDKTIETQKHMMESTQLIRLFGKCFVNNTDSGKDHGLYEDFTKKLFPFFNRNLPVFERHDGEVVENRFPSEGAPKYERDQDHLFEYIQTQTHGKGILISASNKHARDLIKLIRVLRALNNELPIQIFHKGDITPKNRGYIISSAQAEVDELLDPALSTDYQNVFPDLDLQDTAKLASKFGSKFPKQDVWFVNIRNTIEKDYEFSFPGYANKLLALFFTSFKEVLLFDADTIPLLKPSSFFKMKEYTSKGAFFFKDRTLRDYNDFVETNFFALLMPTLPKNSMDQLFGIPVVSEFTLNNTYMTGWRHLQESGIVAIEKSKHLTGIAMTLPLSVWREPVQSSVWGDKELYWIALSAAGDEEYVFNENGAASVGVVQSDEQYQYYPASAAREVCSTHPGHVNKDGELLWINSGFSYCKKNGQFRDRHKFPFDKFETDDLKKMYETPLVIKHAIVPPELPKLRPMGGPVETDAEERAMKQSWKDRPKDMDEINENVRKTEDHTRQIKDWNPQKGWIKSQICSGYYYCAYDVVDTYSTFDKNGDKVKLFDNEGMSLADAPVDKGRLYHFEEEKIDLYQYLSKIWSTGTTKYLTPSEQKKIEDEREARKKAMEAKG